MRHADGTSDDSRFPEVLRERALRVREGGRTALADGLEDMADYTDGVLCRQLPETMPQTDIEEFLQLLSAERDIGAAIESHHAMVHEGTLEALRALEETAHRLDSGALAAFIQTVSGQIAEAIRRRPTVVIPRGSRSAEMLQEVLNSRPAYAALRILEGRIDPAFAELTDAVRQVAEKTGDQAFAEALTDLANYARKLNR